MKISDIKNQASLSLDGSLFKAIIITAFYSIINILLQLFLNFLGIKFENHEGILMTIQILINIAFLPFAYGLITSLIKLSKDEKVGYTDFINTSLLNYTKVIALFVNIFIRVLPSALALILFIILPYFFNDNAALNTLFSICFLVSIFYTISLSLNYALCLFVNYDNSSNSCKDILSKSKALMKGHKIKFVLLLLSFFLWFIILGLVFNILRYFMNPQHALYLSNLVFSIITPMITISQYIFYDDLTNSTIKENKK